MEDLIEALNIFLTYGNPKYPFHCEHDELTVHGIEPEQISKSDRVRLQELGFEIEVEGEKIEDGEGDCYEESRIYSFRYGSC